jgi:hypothetical protein
LAEAQAIAVNVDVVVGMSAAMPDTDAIAFTGSFYEALGAGEDVQTAFELACNAIEMGRGSDGCRRRDVEPPAGPPSEVSAQIPELLVRIGRRPPTWSRSSRRCDRYPAAGSVNQNVEPSPSRLRTPMSPPWAATSCLQMLAHGRFFLERWPRARGRPRACGGPSDRG